jgi:hypothetical protein
MSVYGYLFRKLMILIVLAQNSQSKSVRLYAVVHLCVHRTNVRRRRQALSCTYLWLLDRLEDGKVFVLEDNLAEKPAGGGEGEGGSHQPLSSQPSLSVQKEESGEADIFAF